MTKVWTMKSEGTGMIKAMVTEKSIYHDGENPIHGEGNTRLILTDEAGGGFFELRQSNDYGDQCIRLELDEISAIYNHASNMIQEYDKAVD